LETAVSQVRRPSRCRYPQFCNCGTYACSTSTRAWGTPAALAKQVQSCLHQTSSALMQLATMMLVAAWHLRLKQATTRLACRCGTLRGSATALQHRPGALPSQQPLNGTASLLCRAKHQAQYANTKAHNHSSQSTGPATLQCMHARLGNAPEAICHTPTYTNHLRLRS
jgi:hypothetical protein